MGFVLKLAVGKFKENPFHEADLQGYRKEVMKIIGMDVAEDKVAEGQVMHLNLIAEVLKSCGDPDWAFIPGLAEGVNLGVDDPLPRTPGVFEEKGRWKLSEDVDPGVSAAENYKSFGPHAQAVKNLFTEEEKLGWMVEMPFSYTHLTLPTTYSV